LAHFEQFEKTRALALRGAEILVIPAGLNKRRLWGELAGS
jgi:hypothetical protein